MPKKKIPITNVSYSRDPWDIHRKDMDEVGANMAEFALGSIASMALKNPPAVISGSLPRLGSRLKVDWVYATAVFACIAAVHSALSTLAIYIDWWNRTALSTTNEPASQLQGH